MALKRPKPYEKDIVQTKSTTAMKLQSVKSYFESIHNPLNPVSRINVGNVFLQTTDMWRLSLFLSAQTHLKSKTVSKERDVIWTWYDLHCKNINMVYMTRTLCSSTSRFVFSGPADFTLHGSLDACLEQQPSWSYTYIYINPCCLRLTMTEASVKNHTAVLGSLQVKTFKKMPERNA